MMMKGKKKLEEEKERLDHVLTRFSPFLFEQRRVSLGGP